MHIPLRVFIEKKQGCSVQPKNILKELKDLFGLPSLESVRVLIFYEVFGLSAEDEGNPIKEILSEIPTDIFSTAFHSAEGKFISAEYLPGQFDQRADSAEVCFSLLYGHDNIKVKSGKILDLIGNISKREIEKIKQYWINPIEMREKDLGKEPFFEVNDPASPPEIISGFIKADKSQLRKIHKKYNLTMTFEDLKFCQDYFSSCKRDPFLTELRVLDTYWSDHCRHTTFETHLSDISFPDSGITEPLKKVWKLYNDIRIKNGKENIPVTLMDIATIWGREMLRRGDLKDLEISDEINAASLRVDVDTPAGEEKWFLMFKNETHNHPTEIEPFGGASTCIGGAIRDPLSGRAYVYQAVRVTGSADPRTPLGKTPEGKLPQRYITTRAASGYSAYGNQVGLATSYIKEIYDQGYLAKRMEVGAVVGAAPEKNVVRGTPEPGDVVLVIGGATGRDGCGGATGSSKSHNRDSILKAGSEVQKGNAPEERKIQRLFRSFEAAALIKRCNDFGAGGASVAVGELSPGVKISLDKLPIKYSGISATELAISESQERMAVVVSKENAGKMISLADRENLEAVPAAEITGENSLVMEYQGRKVVDLDRTFLDTNGVKRKHEAVIREIEPDRNPFLFFRKEVNFKAELLNRFKNLDICSRKGLVEMFDNTVGAGTVLLPLGGIYQETESEASVHLLPVSGTKTASVLSSGYNPVIAKWSPFHGAVYAVIESLCRIVACGGQWRRTRFSFQEYFPSPGSDPELWGLPLASLLGGLWIQSALNLPAVGGKDSMSGTFENIRVPPTLISFALSTAKGNKVISPEFKHPGNFIYLFSTGHDNDYLPDIEKLITVFNTVEENIEKGTVISVWSLKEGGIAEGLVKMSLGNRLGAVADLTKAGIGPFDLSYGSFLIEASREFDYSFADELGRVVSEHELRIKTRETEEKISLDEVRRVYRKPQSSIFPERKESVVSKVFYGYKEKKDKNQLPLVKSSVSIISEKPVVLIPVFFGTNCEYESSSAFEKEGAEVETFIFRSRTSDMSKESLGQLSERIKESQILFLPGGFSAGDEPGGSGKFIAAVLKTTVVMDAVYTLLEKGGLILGICNGFQALIKSGLLPYGEIGKVDENSPSLIENSIGRHISTIAPTRYTGAVSPWLEGFYPGEIHHLPFSHGEGCFKASERELKKLFDNAQVAFQYADLNGNPDIGKDSINGSDGGVEGLISPDGRILGKMGHSERYREMLYKNYPGFKVQNIFASGVKYFK